MERGLTRIAVVGCGAWGRNLIRTCAELGVLGAVIDTDAAAAAREAAAWSVPALPLAQALDDAGLDAMIIAAPAEAETLTGKTDAARPGRAPPTETGPVAAGSEPRFVDLLAEPPLTRETRHFIRCRQTRDAPFTGIEEGVRAQRVLERVQFQLNRCSDQLRT